MLRNLNAALVVLVTLVGTSPAPAETERSVETVRKVPHWRAREIVRRLDLSDDQKKLIRPILADNESRLREMRRRFAGQEPTPNPGSALSNERRRIHGETRRRLETILSPEQLAAYDGLVQEWRAKRHPRDRGPSIDL